MANLIIWGAKSRKQGEVGMEPGDPLQVNNKAEDFKAEGICFLWGSGESNPEDKP